MSAREKEDNERKISGLPVVPAAPVNSPTWRRRTEEERGKKGGGEDCDMRERSGGEGKVCRCDRGSGVGGEGGERRRRQAITVSEEESEEERKEDWRGGRRDDQARAQQQKQTAGGRRERKQGASGRGEEKTEWEREIEGEHDGGRVTGTEASRGGGGGRRWRRRRLVGRGLAGQTERAGAERGRF